VATLRIYMTDGDQVVVFCVDCAIAAALGGAPWPWNCKDLAAGVAMPKNLW